MLKNGSVIVSTAHDIVRNLSLEDWLYRNIKCSVSDLSFLLMWRNGPAVVIGRHQNPWLECNLRSLSENGVTLVRRNSGGGTVYHDMGNLNCSFFTPRRKYNRENNLRVICQALKRWNLDICISGRHDLLWNGHKVSGTASKLGSENAYHHCTLLLNVNRTVLHQVLHNNIEGVESKATKSVRASVQNLIDVNSDLNEQDVIKEIANVYQQAHQSAAEGISLVSPREEVYPGLDSITDQLRSWDWTYGKTPRFKLTRTFAPLPGPNNSGTMKIVMSVFHGIIEDLNLELESLVDVLPPLKGTKFSEEDVQQCLDNWLKETDATRQEIVNFITTCCLKMVRDVSV